MQSTPVIHARPAGRGAQVLAVSSALPEHVVGNGPIAERLGVSEDWIVTRTGIHERRHAAPETCVADLAAEAGGRALARAGIDPDELDAVLVATSSPDDFIPNTAPLVAEQLQAHGATAIDVGAACTGWLSALALGAGLLEAARAHTVLVIGAEIMSRLLDPDDRRTAALFGDGAGAVVLGSSNRDSDIGPIILRSDATGADAIVIARDDPCVRMDGHSTFQHAVRRLSEVSTEALVAAGYGQEDIDLYVYHQANGRILDAVADRLALPRERVLKVVDHYGNTSAASIPIALADAAAHGRLSGEKRILVAAFGAGFTWGAGVLQWRPPRPEADVSCDRSWRSTDREHRT
jgi:3-oxoacyl-[acyl-carrier-protein] synthase-3